MMSKIINWNNFVIDSSNKRRYQCFCVECGKDRGHLRSAKRFLLCQSCGQKGKKSGRKGQKCSQKTKEKISVANNIWKKEKSKLPSINF